MSYLANIARAARNMELDSDLAETTMPASLAPTTKAIKTSMSDVDRQALAAKVTDKWAPRPEAAADPLAAADQTGRPASDGGWSKAVAAIPDTGGAVASGGPFEPHPSIFQE